LRRSFNFAELGIKILAGREVEEFRGKGIGKRVFNILDELMKEKGFEVLLRAS
jgi:5-carboxymethyl-2-hydroxymuconate isomerase